MIRKSLAFILLLLTAVPLDAQLDLGKGSYRNRKVGVHDGNEVETVFTNYGLIGQPGNQGPQCSWRHPANGYASEIQPLVGVRLPIRDYRVKGVHDGKPDTLYSVVGCNADRSGTPDYDPGGSTFWGFEPLAGFSDPGVKSIGVGAAMSHLPNTWPSFWPDHPEWVDANGNAQWNGYFGRGIQNADQESYYMMDDHADEKMYIQHGFLPDSTDRTRRGQGLRVAVRGFQWANPLAQDILYWHYEITNIGTEIYDQAVFGSLVGTWVGIGGSGGNSEWMDDASYFDVKESIVYTWDFDGEIRQSSNPYWTPDPSEVGYIGYAFMESPGNPYDGIDNDGDNVGSAPLFQESDFQPRFLRAGDVLILIDRHTYERTQFIMPAEPAVVTSMGRTYRLVPDSTLLEEGNMHGTSLNANAYDGVDNDFDGLIDENYQVHYRQVKKNLEGFVFFDAFNPVAHIDYLTGAGLDDPLIDEKRNDGIDNDGDWDPRMDDVGADGRENTYDEGEGDGVPTAGEPNFDATDKDESDQIGLTSFDYFVPSTDVDMSDENEMWMRMHPGRFDVPDAVVDNRTVRGEDGDFIFGSGYFPLHPGETQRFSLALVFGENLDAVIRSKDIAQKIYDANYNFPRPPEKPTLRAVPGDGKVTLYWDKVAEESFDKTLQEYDFEGYKIYRGTDVGFSDSKTISDGYGQSVAFEPIAQFDRDNGVTGFFNADPILYEKNSGRSFYLGDDTGVLNSFTDTDVINGKTYYYAVTAYDHGSEGASIFPSENTMSVRMNAAGEITLDRNTVAVEPQAPVAGYVAPDTGVPLTRLSGASTHVPVADVIDPHRQQEGTYFVTFTDSLVQGVPVAWAYTVTDSATGEALCTDNPRLIPSNGDVFDGFRFAFDIQYQKLDSVRLDPAASGWNRDEAVMDYVIKQFEWNQYKSIRYPRDYEFVFSDVYAGASSDLAEIFGTPSPFKAKQTNLTVFDVTDPNTPVEIRYGFIDSPGARQDSLSHFDSVYLTNPGGDELSWVVTFKGQEIPPPGAGDTLRLSFYKPFSAKDRFVYRAGTAVSDIGAAQNPLEAIRAVPNPYVVTNVYEQPLPTQYRGRGERVVYFTHLPVNATINIYASNGHHVRSLQHDGDLSDGTCRWDLRSKEGLDIACGIYFYVVEAEGITETKIGKLAVIK